MGGNTILVFMIYQPETKKYWMRATGLSWVSMKDGTILNSLDEAKSIRATILQASTVETKICIFRLERI